MCVTRKLFCPTGAEMAEILATVYANGPMTYSDIVTKIKMNESKIKENIDELKRLGYLTEEKHVYSVTEKVKRLFI